MEENTSTPYSEFIRGFVISAVILLGAVLAVIVVWNLRSFLLIAFACWVFSVALSLPISRFQKLGLKRGTAIIATLVSTVIFFLLVIIIVIPPLVTQVADLIGELPEATEDAIAAYEDFYNDNADLQTVLPEITTDGYEEVINDTDGDTIAGTEVPSQFSFQSIASSTAPIIGGVGNLIGNVFANLIIIIFITIYLVLDPITYYRGLIAVVPAHREQRAIEIVNIMRKTVIAWLGALSVSITFTAVSVTIMLGLILNVPNAVALGVLAGLASFIPYLGFYLALFPVLIVTAADDPAKVIPVLILYVILGEIESKLVTPTVVKNELNIPAGVVLVFQLIAAAYLGFFGILLAVPLLAIIITLVRELYVYDRLHKKNKVPDVKENEEGELYLDYHTIDAVQETTPSRV